MLCHGLLMTHLNPELNCEVRVAIHTYTPPALYGAQSCVVGTDSTLGRWSMAVLPRGCAF
jgi:hypothetical protein